MMIITPNSRAHQGKKGREEVKGKYGGVCGEMEGIVRISSKIISRKIKIMLSKFFLVAYL